MAKTIRQYKFERTLKESIWAGTEEEAYEKLRDMYGVDADEFELVDVKVFKETE